jgi:hypothetical protein
MHSRFGGTRRDHRVLRRHPMMPIRSASGQVQHCAPGRGKGATGDRNVARSPELGIELVDVRVGSRAVEELEVDDGADHDAIRVEGSEPRVGI